MGEELLRLLKERHINVSSLAEAMGVKPQTFQSYGRSRVLGDEILMRITSAVGWDLYGEMKRRQANAMGYASYSEKENMSAVREAEGPTYKRTSQGGRDSFQMSVNLDDFEDADQLRIIRFIQQLPRRKS